MAEWEVQFLDGSSGTFEGELVLSAEEGLGKFVGDDGELQSWVNLGATIYGEKLPTSE